MTECIISLLFAIIWLHVNMYVHSILQNTAQAIIFKMFIYVVCSIIRFQFCLYSGGVVAVFCSSIN